MAMKKIKLVTWENWVMMLTCLLLFVGARLWLDFKETGTVPAHSVWASLVTVFTSVGIMAGTTWWCGNWRIRTSPC